MHGGINFTKCIYLQNHYHNYNLEDFFLLPKGSFRFGFHSNLPLSDSQENRKTPSLSKYELSLTDYYFLNAEAWYVFFWIWLLLVTVVLKFMLLNILASSHLSIAGSILLSYHMATHQNIFTLLLMLDLGLFPGLRRFWIKFLQTVVCKSPCWHMFHVFIFCETTWSSWIVELSKYLILKTVSNCFLKRVLFFFLIHNREKFCLVQTLSPQLLDACLHNFRYFSGYRQFIDFILIFLSLVIND